MQQRLSGKYPDSESTGGYVVPSSSFSSAVPAHMVSAELEALLGQTKHQVSLVSHVVKSKLCCVRAAAELFAKLGRISVRMSSNPRTILRLQPPSLSGQFCAGHVLCPSVHPQTCMRALNVAGSACCVTGSAEVSKQQQQIILP